MAIIRGIFGRKKKRTVCAIGDSHTRVLSKNRNFRPFFLGPGKQYNFINDQNCDRVLNATRGIVGSGICSDFVFVLGEPDCRYLLGKGWYPWEGNVEFELSDYRQKVKEYTDRYMNFLSEIKHEISGSISVLNVTPTLRRKQNEITNFYNDQLRKKLEKSNINFISINKYIYESGEEDRIIEEYLGDTVHLNNKIQPLVEQELISLGILEKSRYSEKTNWDHINIKDGYVFDKRFGCFIEKN